MSDTASDPAEAAEPGQGVPETGAVVVGVVPGEPARVLKVAARYAQLLDAPLVVANVDVTRFVAYEDPDGTVQTAPLDLALVARENELARVRAEVAEALGGCAVSWRLQELLGDPALAMKELAEKVDAKLLVVGTRKRGLGESIREFFTGSVAVRLAHRQTRPVLVVPIGDTAADDEPLFGDAEQGPATV